MICDLLAGGLPDPLTFTADALARRGALVEVDDGATLALLPPDVAAELGLAEAIRLALDVDDSVVGAEPPSNRCGLGSPLLERLMASPWPAVAAQLVVDATPPRAAQARAQAERVVFRNAVAEITGARVATARYAAAVLAWSAVADDRYEGTVMMAAAEDDGASPEPSVVDALTWGRPATEPFPSLPGTLADLLLRRAGPTLDARLRAARDAVERRYLRDHARIVEYFEELANETRSRARRVEAESLKAKLSHVLRERDKKLAELPSRFAIRVDVAPVAALRVEVPVASVDVTVKRRKLTGSFVLRLPAGAARVDALSCAACNAGTLRPALCDDALHVLCERCLPHAEGRPACPACRTDGDRRARGNA